VDNDILYSLTFSNGRDDIIISPTPAAIWCVGVVGERSEVGRADDDDVVMRQRILKKMLRLAKNLSGVYEGK
jgi:hypothetical protein